MNLSLSNEICKNIDGYVGLYKISNLGRVQNISTGRRFIMSAPVSCGYYRVGLTKRGVQNYFLVHRLIALAFIPNPKNKPCINHIDGNKLNNSINNLEWCTYAENNQHAYDIGLNVKLDGEKNHNSKLTKEKIKEIRKSNLSNEELSEMYLVNKSTICKIKNGKAWKHI